MNQDLNGKVIVITGGSSGIGAAAARKLKSLGAHVVITGRSEQTVRLAEELGCDYFLTDYSRLSKVRQLAKELLRKYEKIDVLVNNVGGIVRNRQVTDDGHEMTFQINHLAGFLLTKLLKERLEKSKAIVINTSSMAHKIGSIKMDDLESLKSFSSFPAYGNAKLMNILHASEINRRYKGVTGVSFHPGVVATGFAREGSKFVKWFYEGPLKNLFMITPEKGADTLVWLITTDLGKDWIPGEFYVKRKVGSKTSQAKDLELARKLWEVSELMVEQNRTKATSELTNH